ncbi:hypothetical protein ACFB49_32410 [Sphingomonas sp. DBB INV C78]|uniref:OmpA family protein n=1 Tax=Sphingomonas sp. DBB INV C78 TaxID=3349434 RepID=UPI0036D3678C
MQFVARCAFIMLVPIGALGLNACGAEREEAAAKTEESAPQLDVIGLPNGATILAARGSPGFEIANYLASEDVSSRSFILGGSEFAPWSAKPQPEAEARLATLAQLLSAYPNAKAKIVGHTDNVGTAEENRRLSLERAQAVVELLVGRGVNKDQLEAQGMGMDQPIASNDTDAGRSQNRRISIILDRVEATD